MADTHSPITIFSGLPDSRMEHSREHELTALLVNTVRTLLVGGVSFYDMVDFGHAGKGWMQTFLRLPGGIPSHDTFNRLFRALDPAAFPQWTQELRQRLGREFVALDGKAARRATVAGQSPRHLISARARSRWARSAMMSPSCPRCHANSIRPGSVTADALPCQRNLAKEITEADADYVLVLNGNEGTMHGDVRGYLAAAIARQAPELITLSTVDKSRRRLKTRGCCQCER